MNIGLIIAIVVVVLLISYAIGIYNKLVTLRNRVRDQWAQIDVQLKRRSDLIPNLVETVKGYAAHEKETFAAIVEARNNFDAAKNVDEEIKASNELTGAIGRLFAVAEAYPDLKSNQNFLELQKDLRESEDKIALNRQFYNDTILSYNNVIEMFPSNIFAGIFKFKKETFFEVSEIEKEVPKVSF